MKWFLGFLVGALLVQPANGQDLFCTVLEQKVAGYSDDLVAEGKRKVEQAETAFGLSHPDLEASDGKHFSGIPSEIISALAAKFAHRYTRDYFDPTREQGAPRPDHLTPLFLALGNVGHMSGHYALEKAFADFYKSVYGVDLASLGLVIRAHDGGKIEHDLAIAAFVASRLGLKPDSAPDILNQYVFTHDWHTFHKSMTEVLRELSKEKPGLDLTPKRQAEILAQLTWFYRRHNFNAFVPKPGLSEADAMKEIAKRYRTEDGFTEFDHKTIYNAFWPKGYSRGFVPGAPSFADRMGVSKDLPQAMGVIPLILAVQDRLDTLNPKKYILQNRFNPQGLDKTFSGPNDIGRTTLPLVKAVFHDLQKFKLRGKAVPAANILKYAEGLVDKVNELGDRLRHMQREEGRPLIPADEASSSILFRENDGKSGETIYRVHQGKSEAGLFKWTGSEWVSVEKDGITKNRADGNRQPAAVDILLDLAGWVSPDPVAWVKARQTP